MLEAGCYGGGAVISGVHANVPALTAVLAEIMTEAERLVFSD